MTVHETPEFGAVERRVVKLGGSLFSMPGLIDAFRDWLAAQSAAETLLIAGGGAPADAIRELNRLHNLSESAAHWLCIRAMHLQTEMLAAILPESDRVTSIQELRDQSPRARLATVDPYQFLREEDRQLSAEPLPESWNVTSDSIAARLAMLSRATELVLLKSVAPSHDTASKLAESNFVDRCFPRAAQGIMHLRVVNLRDAKFAQVVLRSSSE